MVKKQMTVKEDRATWRWLQAVCLPKWKWNSNIFHHSYHYLFRGNILCFRNIKFSDRISLTKKFSKKENSGKEFP